MASTNQFACVAALPCGDGELQQVNVQNTHIVCVMQRNTCLLKCNLFLFPRTRIVVYITVL